MAVITGIIPVFNRAQRIGRAIESALVQDLPAGCSLKVIVVDDGSSDDLPAALKSYGNAITCIRHPRNVGAAAARNTGIEAAEDGFLAFLNSDDVWLPGKLNAQLEAMRRSGWLASCHAFYMGRHGRPDVVAPTFRTGTLGLDDIAWGCFTGPGSTMVCSRSVMREIGPLDATLRRLEDWDWQLRYGLKYRLGFLGQPLARTDPSALADGSEALAALAVLRARHVPNLNTMQRRRFLAGMDVVVAALRYRSGDRLGALAPGLASILRSPFGNRAWAAILHNRLA